MQAEAGVTMVFGGKAVLTWCSNGNAVSKECLGDEGREPPGQAITDGDGEAMMSIGWGRRVTCRLRRCCCGCCCVVKVSDGEMTHLCSGLKPA